MLLTKTAFQDAILPPFIVQKYKQNHSEGNFIIHLFSKVVIDKDYVKKYQYLPLRFDGQYARFKRRNDAVDYARQILGLD